MQVAGWSVSQTDQGCSGRQARSDGAKTFCQVPHALTYYTTAT